MTKQLIHGGNLFRHQRNKQYATRGYALKIRKFVKVLENDMDATNQKFGKSYKQLDSNVYAEAIIIKNGPKPIYNVRLLYVPVEVRDEEELFDITPIFASEWIISFNDYERTNGLLEDSRHYFSLPSSLEWKFNNKENTLYNFDQYYDYASFSNWTNTSTNIILSWIWYNTDDRIPFPYCHGLGGYYLFSSSNPLLKIINPGLVGSEDRFTTPIAPLAPSKINGAALFNNRLVIATYAGIYWLDDGTWLLVDGTDSLLPDAKMPIRFSGSGAKATGVDVYVGTSIRFTLDFELSWNNTENKVELLSSSSDSFDFSNENLYRQTDYIYNVIYAPNPYYTVEATTPSNPIVCPSTNTAGYPLVDSWLVDPETCYNGYVEHDEYADICGVSYRGQAVSGFRVCQYDNPCGDTDCATESLDPCSDFFHCCFVGSIGQNIDNTFDIRLAQNNQKTITTTYTQLYNDDFLIASDYIGEEKVSLYIKYEVDPISGSNLHHSIWSARRWWGWNTVYNKPQHEDPITPSDSFEYTYNYDGSLITRTYLVFKKNEEVIYSYKIAELSDVMHQQKTWVASTSSTVKTNREWTRYTSDTLIVCADLRNYTLVGVNGSFTEEYNGLQSSSDYIYTQNTPLVKVKNKFKNLSEVVDGDNSVKIFPNTSYAEPVTSWPNYGFTCSEYVVQNGSSDTDTRLFWMFPQRSFYKTGVTTPNGDVLFSADINSTLYPIYSSLYNDVRGHVAVQGLFSAKSGRIHRVQNVYKPLDENNPISFKWDFMTYDEVQGSNNPHGVTMMTLSNSKKS